MVSAPHPPTPMPPTAQSVKAVYSRPSGRSRLSWTRRRAWLLTILVVLGMVTFVVLYFAGF